MLTVAVLCTLTSFVCVWLLARAWAAARVPLLLWSLVCFAGLALNNVLLVVDELTGDEPNLDGWRSLPAAVGVAALCYGLVVRGERR